MFDLSLGGLEVLSLAPGGELLPCFRVTLVGRESSRGQQRLENLLWVAPFFLVLAAQTSSYQS